MKRLIVLSLIIMVMLMGCAPQQKLEQKAVQKGDVIGETKSQIKFKIEDTSLGTGEQDISDVVVEDVVPTMEATVEKDDTVAADEWCKEGATWDFKTTQEGIDASANWIIKGLVTDGEYAGLCHVLYTAQTPMGETTMDYYFAEDKESGYVEIKLPNGQTMKQEWHG